MEKPAMETETPHCSRKKSGIVITILQKEFKDYVSRSEEDIEADTANIEKCFLKLGFTVEEPLIDGTQGDIIKHLEDKVRDWKTLSQYECIFVIFVTNSPAHGKLLCRKEDNIEICTIDDENIVGLMKGEKYSNLLKIFIFQASQATRLEELGKQTDDVGAGGGWIPDEANLFVIKSSFERKSSPTQNGSFFLKVFCENMANIGNDTSLFDVMTAVLRELKANRNNVNTRNNILPDVTSTLLKPMNLHLEEKTTIISTNYEVKKSIGKLIVISYTKNTEHQTVRLGAKEDVNGITRSFQSFGFTVKVFWDLKADEVRNVLDYGNVLCKNKACKDAAQCDREHNRDARADYSDDTCVAVAIMGHGKDNSLITVDERMNIGDIINRLITPKGMTIEREDLSGKPKLFFLQICRQNIYHPAHPITAPLESDDTLVFHSCYQGYEANRDVNGSWLIQQLCKTMDENRDESVSLINILQKVQIKIVENKEHNKKQMPVICSSLTNNLIFKTN